jgi:hypothetical protein
MLELVEVEVGDWRISYYRASDVTLASEWGSEGVHPTLAHQIWEGGRRNEATLKAKTLVQREHQPLGGFPQGLQPCTAGDERARIAAKGKLSNAEGSGPTETVTCSNGGLRHVGVGLGSSSSFAPKLGEEASLPLALCGENNEARKERLHSPLSELEADTAA